jgi:hypothetical protein
MSYIAYLSLTASGFLGTASPMSKAMVARLVLQKTNTSNSMGRSLSLVVKISGDVLEISWIRVTSICTTVSSSVVVIRAATAKFKYKIVSIMKSNRDELHQTLRSIIFPYTNNHAIHIPQED